ncbi:MAG: DUF4331 domain-containing protein [Deltaproteobacteria bacterium]|nr:DUF4331 domain-containing protein [Deltaproteobacteria bacterium]
MHSTTYLLLPLALLTCVDQTDTRSGDDDGDELLYPGAEIYQFADDPPEAYVQVDRVAMPAVTMLLVDPGEGYNYATVDDDLDALFLDDITANLAELHARFDDDVLELGYPPCKLAQCVLHVGPLVIPDTLRLHVIGKPRFPNGRWLGDRAIDIMMAHSLLDPWTQPPDVLIGQLGPIANDVPFLAEFPYLAPPHP